MIENEDKKKMLVIILIIIAIAITIISASFLSKVNKVSTNTNWKENWKAIIQETKKIQVKEQNVSKKLNIENTLKNTVTLDNPKEDLVNQISNICSQAGYTKQGTDACKKMLNNKSIIKQLWNKIVNSMKKEYNLNK